ncbi:unnamed protein product [Kuraishia capsulata CBS 1993]|uniref:C2H2-type domain-containing protein n=1 Tax=Kuraishia capsulata CBS 1993 TaxID=1382522 RepID=W6MSP0_9ASCO|nr:uncharacterized protein KUCA_T00000767001 [Kuraishia capsulata CBS 1993]CDK24800.1 unnamed protein product [Kuraishia capsulata CBS 1993]
MKMTYENADTRLKYEASSSPQAEIKTGLPNILNPAPFSSVISVNSGMSWGLQRSEQTTNSAANSPVTHIQSSPPTSQYAEFMIRQNGLNRLLPPPENQFEASSFGTGSLVNAVTPNVGVGAAIATESVLSGAASSSSTSGTISIPTPADPEEWNRKAADIAMGRVPKPVRSEPQVFICDACEKRFSRRMNLKSHKNSKHAGQKPFACSFCEQRFARYSDQKRHETIQHGGDKVLYRCSGVNERGERWGCNKKFKRKDGLAAHWKSKKAKTKCLKEVIDQRQKELTV